MLLQVAANHGWWLVVFGDGHGLVAAFACGHVNVAAHEVQEIRALQEQLRHPGIVVVRAETWQSVQPLVSLRAHGVRHEGAEGLSAEAFGGNRLLLVVEPVAVVVLRTHQHRAG